MKRMCLGILVCLFAVVGCGEGDNDENLHFADSLGWVDDVAEGDDGLIIPDDPLPDSTWVPPGKDIAGQPDEWTQPKPDVQDPPQPAGPCSKLQAQESIADLQAGYSSGNWKNVLVQIVDRRYDPGHYILTHAKDQSQMVNWVKTGSFKDLVMSTSTAVHEMNHMYGWELGGWTNYAYFMCEELTITIPNIETTPRSVVYDTLDPNIGGMVMDYAGIYLTGQMGSQGFPTLLDELNAYIHSMFVDYQISDQLSFGTSISSLDGLATFMLFTELFLKWVRINAPAEYQSYLTTNNLVDLILALFERAEWIIENSKDKANSLSIMAEPVLDQVFDPDNYMEIELLKP